MNKIVKKCIIYISIIFIGIVIFSIIIYSPEYMYRVLRYGNSDVNDYRIFSARIIEHSTQPYYYVENILDDLKNQLVSYKSKGKDNKKDLKCFLEDTNTTAFIVIHNDKIVFEQYINGYSRDSINTSFSSVKSIVSLLIGIAIDEGYIESEEQSIVEYIYEFKDTPMEKIKIKDLLMMRSEIKYEEGRLWFSDDAKTYYWPDLRELAVKHIKIDTKYNGDFHYNNYHPLLLGIILERSTGQSVANFLEEKIWKKIGTEYNASWSLDSKESGFEKMESGLNFRSIDIAKIGTMLLNNGHWNGEKIVSKKWIKKSIIPQMPINYQEYNETWLENKGVVYQYMWYILKNKKGGYDYYAAGKYGQYLYLSPQNNILIVRNGINTGEVDWWPGVLEQITDIIAEI